MTDCDDTRPPFWSLQMPTIGKTSSPRELELLERALERSGLSPKRFAREELVRDPKTLRAYRRGAAMPGVVLDKIAQLARRRRSVKT